MANKKCPKCGEDNPAEAVMCWACYTPLSGAAPLTASAAAIPATAGAAGKIGAPGVDVSDNEKKGIDPKAIGIGAVLLIGLAIAGFVTFGMGSGGGGDEATPTDPVPAGDPGPGAGAPPPPPVASGPPPVFTPSGGGAPVAAVPLPFTTVVQPNPAYATGTVGIISNNANLSPTQAIGLAKSARQQFMANGRWKNMQIAVFTNPTSAKAFQTYQASRKGQKLESNDYQTLASQGVWSGAAAFYETIGRSEYPYYPSRNPTAWWGRR